MSAISINKKYLDLAYIAYGGDLYQNLNKTQYRLYTTQNFSANNYVLTVLLIVGVYEKEL